MRPHTLLLCNSKGDDEMSNRKVEPHENDVLMGRGGKNNAHIGNEKLRQIARSECEAYRMSSKKGKSIISRKLVQAVREMSPPGRCVLPFHVESSIPTTGFWTLSHCILLSEYFRFLRKTESGNWEDVGDEIAREKASQVLRDAVALKLGPLGVVSANKSKTERRVDRESKQVEEDEERTYGRASSAFPPPTMAQRELKPDAAPIVGSGVWAAGTPRGPYSSSGAPPYLPVTPVSSSYRHHNKRPRYFHESPLTHPNEQYATSRPFQTSTPPWRVYPPPQRPQFDHPGHYQYPAPNSAPRETGSGGRLHYVPPTVQSGVTEPGMFDEPNLHHAEFDLFHEELLSDQSDRESPSPFRHIMPRGHDRHHDSL